MCDFILDVKRAGCKLKVESLVEPNFWSFEYTSSEIIVPKENYFEVVVSPFLKKISRK